jgi:hypothetical protein
MALAPAFLERIQPEMNLEILVGAVDDGGVVTEQKTAHRRHQGDEDQVMQVKIGWGAAC